MRITWTEKMPEVGRNRTPGPLLTSKLSDMKIKKTDVERISIWSRGKNRDIYGNPYYAYVCRISLTQKARGEREITLRCPMSWGSSGAYDVFAEVVQELDREFGISLNYDDVRSGLVVQRHQTVRTEDALMRPERWRLA